MTTLKTLKLDAAWQPIEIISADRGFSMVFGGRAQVIEEHSAGPCENYSFPSVIVLKSYIRKKVVRTSPTRRNIYYRDKYTCQYCCKKFPHSQLTLDHVIPKSRGGGGGWENLVTACKTCNQKKGSLTPYEASMTLMQEPKEPRFSIIELYHNLEIPQTWLKFIRTK